MDLPRQHFRVSIIESPPYVKIERRTEYGFEISGVLAHVIKILAASLNFSYELQMPPDKTWGVRSANGTWDGFIAMLLKNHTDVALGGILGVTYDRSQAISYTKEYDMVTVSFLASAAEQGLTSFFAFLLSIEVQVWISLAVSFLALITTCSFADTFQPGADNTFLARLEINFWLFWSSLFCEGSPRFPPTRWSQVLLSMWLIFVLVFSTCLTGNFKAALMAKDQGDTMSTLTDLLHNENVMPLMVASSYFSQIFQSADQESHKKLYERSAQNPEKGFILSPALTKFETYQKVKNGSFALGCAPDITKSYISQFFSRFTGSRRFYFIPETSGFYYVGLGVRKDFSKSFLELMSKRIIWINEAGLINFWKQEMMRDYWKLEADSGNTEGMFLGFAHLQSFFLLMLLLEALCIIQLLIEKYVLPPRPTRRRRRLR